MNIIICDDSQNDRKILIELLQSYAQEKKQCFERIGCKSLLGVLCS